MPEPLDVIELLMRDHRLLDRLLDQLDAEEDRAKLAELLELIGRELSAHEAAEQEVIFPAFRKAMPSAELGTRQRLGEHEEINEVIAEMRALTPTNPGFAKRASALILDVRAHFETEEESFFPNLRAMLGPEQLVALVQPVMAAKRSAPPFPAPDRVDHVHLRLGSPSSRK